MNIGAATSTPLTLPGMAGVPAPRPPRASDEGEAAALAAMRSVSLRSRFSAQEVAAVERTVAPTLADDATPHSSRSTTDWVLASVAKVQARGEDALVLSIAMPGGGSMTTVMSAAEFTAALASDDPDSFGSMRLEGGPTYNHKDLIKQSLSQLARPEWAQAGPVAAEAALDVMRAITGDDATTDGMEEASKIRSLVTEFPSADPSGSGPRVSITVLPAGPGDQWKADGAGMLDVLA